MLVELLIVIAAICFITIPLAGSSLSAASLTSVFFGTILLCLIIVLYWFLTDYDDTI